MAVIMSATLTGGDAVKQLFSQARLRAAREAGLQAALGEISNQAQKSAAELVYDVPVEWERTGAYGESLDIGGPGNIATADVGADLVVFGSNVPEAAYLEFGTPAHEIFPRLGTGAGGSSLLAFTWHGEDRVFRHVHHPGTKPRPVLAHAFDIGGPAINTAYSEAFFAALSAGMSVRTVLVRRAPSGSGGGARTAGAARVSTRGVKAPRAIRLPSSRTPLRVPSRAVPRLNPIAAALLRTLRQAEERAGRHVTRIERSVRPK